MLVIGAGDVTHGARAYDPQVGRWGAKDPVLFAGDGPNLFTYNLGDPSNRVDPSGEGFLDCPGAFARYLECKSGGDRSLDDRRDENVDYDPGHETAIEQKENRCEKLRQKALRACKNDAEILGKLVVNAAAGVVVIGTAAGVIVIAVAGSLVGAS